MLFYLLLYRELFICHFLTASSISKKTLLERIFLLGMQYCYTKDTKGLILFFFLTLLNGKDITPICISVHEGGISLRILVQQTRRKKKYREKTYKQVCKYRPKCCISQNAISSIWRLCAFWVGFWLCFLFGFFVVFFFCNG